MYIEANSKYIYINSKLESIIIYIIFKINFTYIENKIIYKI